MDKYMLTHEGCRIFYKANELPDAKHYVRENGGMVYDLSLRMRVL